jgi:hypothetical protein
MAGLERRTLTAHRTPYGAYLAGADANTTLTTSSPKFIRVVPTASRDYTLPAIASSAGLWFVISNFSAGANNVVVKKPDASTLVTLNQNEAAVIVCNGTDWFQMGVITIAQS